MQFSGVIVVVTGASQGIGKEIALQFAREGAHVCALARNQIDLDGLVEKIKATGGHASAHAVDVTKAVSIRETINEIGQTYAHIDILVHAVGGFKRLLPVEEITEIEWDEVLNINLKSVFLCTQAVVPWMKIRPSGRIILLGSIAGVSPNPHAKSYLPYGAAKAGVLGYTKHLAKELGGFGITVNAVSPGTTATERVMHIRSENDLQKLAAANPLNHRIEPSDSAAAVLFLASPQAKGITGVNLNVNAGSVML